MAKEDLKGMVDGTLMSKSTMARLLEASRAAVGEGVAGTSPTPGQDDIEFIPPTTSDVTNPGVLGGEDPTKERVGDKDTLPSVNKSSDKAAEEAFQSSLNSLFVEDDDDDNGDKKKDGEPDDDDKVYIKGKKGKKKDKKDDNDDDNGKDDNGKDDKAECMEVRCEACGYEETYDLSEQAIALNPPPMTEGGQIDTKCPMCGADMDFSLIGATDQEKITDPNPIAGPRGEGGTEVPQEALAYARTLMRRVAEGQPLDDLAKEVVESDFLVRV